MKKKRGLVSCIQEFKKDTILTPIFVIGEVAFDVLIPMMTGRLLTQGVEAGNMERIFYYGGIVVLMALAALLLGALSGRYAARAATGDNRNQLVLMMVIDMTVYHIFCIHNPDRKSVV